MYPTYCIALLLSPLNARWGSARPGWVSPPLSPARAQFARADGWGVPAPPLSRSGALGACAVVSGGPHPAPGCAL